MVSRVRKADKGSHIYECGNEVVAPWGSILPVYSRQTRMIYKNTVCAQADGVTDGIVWNVLYSCKMKGPDYEIRDASTYMSGFHTEHWSNSCEVHFLYPGDYAEIESLICFEDLITTCPPISFVIPTQLQPMSKKEIRAACRSGLISPYRIVNLYANVFCYICNGNTFSPTSFCEVKTNYLQKTIGGDIVGLIDNRSFLKAKKETESGKHVSKQAYYMNNENVSTNSNEGSFCCYDVI